MVILGHDAWVDRVQSAEHAWPLFRNGSPIDLAQNAHILEQTKNCKVTASVLAVV